MQFRRRLAIGCAGCAGRLCLPLAAGAGRAQRRVAPPRPPRAPERPSCRFEAPAVRSRCAPAAQPPGRLSRRCCSSFELCFGKQGGTPFVPVDTYRLLHPASCRSSASPRQGTWIPYTDAVEQTMRDDFKRLWDQGFLDDLSIEVNDYVFPNGVDRQGRVLSHGGARAHQDRPLRRQQADRSHQDRGAAARPQHGDRRRYSSSTRPKIRRVEAVVARHDAREGVQRRRSRTRSSRLPGRSRPSTSPSRSTKGRAGKIRKVDLRRQRRVFSDDKLAKQLKDNKSTGFLVDHHRRRHASTRRSSKKTPSASRTTTRIAAIRTCPCRHSRSCASSRTARTARRSGSSCASRSPKARKYNFGDLDFDGNKRFRTEYLRSVYAVKPGEIYSRKKIVEGQQAGAGGLRLARVHGVHAVPGPARSAIRA